MMSDREDLTELAGADQAPVRALTAPRQSTVSSVVETITERIRRGVYRPGQRLVEAEMMQAMSVSRSSVREALRRLEADGLVQVEFNKGARIRLMTREEILALNQVREVLEGLAAKLAAARIGLGGYRERMLQLVEAMAQCEERGDWAEYQAQNKLFHNLILEMSGNSALVRTMGRLQLHTFRVQFHLVLSKFAAACSRSDHEIIVEAILDGDGAAAETAMRAHIARTGQWILNAPRTVFD